MHTVELIAQFISFAFTLLVLIGPPYDVRTWVNISAGGYVIFLAASITVLLCGGVLDLPWSIASLAYGIAYGVRAGYLWSLVGAHRSILVWPDKAIALVMGLLLWAAGFYDELIAWANG